ncbi:hypothetical protein [Chitinivorax sp. B]|uniref:hypothetical protein n=1 Tax=Chitinivorax sp. B TaxID=2502235 RepID=UPI0010F4842E|nr:hypothetical protein [Chitinivorax sp. B]
MANYLIFYPTTVGWWPTSPAKQQAIPPQPCIPTIPFYLGNSCLFHSTKVTALSADVLKRMPMPVSHPHCVKIKSSIDIFICAEPEFMNAKDSSLPNEGYSAQ